jgi:hypothetical protein
MVEHDAASNIQSGTSSDFALWVGSNPHLAADCACPMRVS